MSLRALSWGPCCSPPTEKQIDVSHWSITTCHKYVSAWMPVHHLKHSLDKTELLFIPGQDCLCTDLFITIENTTMLLFLPAKNLGMILNNQLPCSVNTATTTHSCMFSFSDSCRICLLLMRELTQLLVQVLIISHQVYCSSFLFGVYHPFCVEPTPFFNSLHWLSISVHI